MEYRKLIKFGASSHVISLPNSWIKKNKLKKGDLIYLEENGNGEIVLNHEIEKKDKQEEFNIICNGDLKELHRKLISGYISGYNVMNIKLKNSVNLSAIRDYIKSLMAFEIIEQSSTEIKAKDLLDIKEISMGRIIRRIDTIARSMMEDTKLSYKIKNYNNIYDRDSDINRLTFLSYRILKKTLIYPKLTDSIGISYKELIDTWMLIFYMEKIADEVKRISRYLTKLTPKNEKVNDVINIYSEVCVDYSKCMDAYYKKDVNTALGIAKKKEEIIKRCDLLVGKNYNPYLFNIIDRIKALETYTRFIGRIIIQQNEIE